MSPRRWHLACSVALPIYPLLISMAFIHAVMGGRFELHDHHVGVIRPSIALRGMSNRDTSNAPPQARQIKCGQSDTSEECTQRRRLKRYNDVAINLTVDINTKGWLVPDTLFGVFLEEINHAGAGGLDAEMVQNRGFEAGGHRMPATVDPWYPVGNFPDVAIQTELSSCFSENPVAVKVDVLCGNEGSWLRNEVLCPYGVGISNPGFWGMNVLRGKRYKAVFWIRATGGLVLTLSLTSFDGSVSYGGANVSIDERSALDWGKYEVELEALGSDPTGRLALTTRQKRTIWLDQVSLKPVNTFKNHGMRAELAEMIAALQPGFVRFPGGCYVEGDRLANAFRWKFSVGPWEERRGHYNGVWGYWSDDGLGFYEYLQFAEDIGAKPVWVFNSGVSHTDQVATWMIRPFVEDVLDAIEFANGPSTSKWGSVRAAMGHTEPFKLEYVAVGNEDCGEYFYKGNYLSFYDAIKKHHPTMKIITNCDASDRPLEHPADLFDYHVYASADRVFSLNTKFDDFPRNATKAFVSEYAVVGVDAGKGSLLAAVAEAAFMTGFERNSDVVEMASYAPLLVNEQDRRWNPDAIVFNSWQQYGTPSYWVQSMFRRTGAPTFYAPLCVEADIKDWAATRVTASATRSICPDLRANCISIKAVNFARVRIHAKIKLMGIRELGSSGLDLTVTTLKSERAMDENSFTQPEKIVPATTAVKNMTEHTSFTLEPLSVNVFTVKLSLGSDVLKPT